MEPRSIYSLVNLGASKEMLAEVVVHLGRHGMACLCNDDGLNIAHQTRPNLTKKMAGCHAIIVICGEPLKQFLAKRIANMVANKVSTLIVHAYEAPARPNGSSKSGVMELWGKNFRDMSEAMDNWLKKNPVAPMPAVGMDETQKADVELLLNRHIPVALSANVYQGGNNAKRDFSCDVFLADLLMYMAHEAVEAVPISNFAALVNKWFQSETWRGRLLALCPGAHAVANVCLSPESTSMIFSVMMISGVIRQVPCAGNRADGGKWQVTMIGHKAVYKRYSDNGTH